MSLLNKILTTLLIGLVRIYQLFISPVMGSNCRFYPTCSSYMIQAIQTHGAIKGLWLGIRRVLRCHPYSDGGVDPVPEPKCCQSSGIHSAEITTKIKQ